MPENCPICKGTAEVRRQSGGVDVFDVFCSRCGNYKITFTLAASNIEGYGSRHLISGIIRNRFEKGEKIDLNSNNLQLLLESTNIPTDPFDIIDLLLEHILRKTGKLNKSFKIEAATNFPLLYLESAADFFFFVKKANELNFLVSTESNSVQLTLDGWKRLSEIKTQKPKSKQAFVAMWFSTDLDSAWENGFKSALIEVGFQPIRIDLQEHNEKICDKIISEIRRSGFVVADFTGQRGGVYFEAGFALGLSIPVIWTCRETDVKNLHFDTRQYNHIVWKDPEDLKTKLINRIRATLPVIH